LVIDFMPTIEADSKWQSWLLRNGLADLDPKDVRVDLGRGQLSDSAVEMRRYSIRSASFPNVQL